MPRAMTVQKARELVLSEGMIPPDTEFELRPEVLSSWRRSILSGAQVGLPELRRPVLDPERERAFGVIVAPGAEYRLPLDSHLQAGAVEVQIQ